MNVPINRQRDQIADRLNLLHTSEENEFNVEQAAVYNDLTQIPQEDYDPIEFEESIERGKISGDPDELVG